MAIRPGRGDHNIYTAMGERRDDHQHSYYLYQYEHPTPFLCIFFPAPVAGQNDRVGGQSQGRLLAASYTSKSFARLPPSQPHREPPAVLQTPCQ